MFRPQLQKTWVMLFVSMFSMMMIYFALGNITYLETVGFNDKKEAVEIMEEALSVLKKEVKNKYPEEPILKDIDPNLTGLIFNRPKSPMTTFSGNLKSKQTVLKPNFSALIVDLFIQAKLSKGDTIAVGMTGSMPGANIALLSACEAMGIVPIIITSIGASQWGATDSNFTWLDLESVLYANKVISNNSSAASLGGKGDEYKEKKVKNIIYGGNRGKELATKAIERNGIKKLKGYKKRISFYKERIKGELSNYSAYINIGGGVSSMGWGGNKKLTKPGLIAPDSVLMKITQDCVIKEFAKNETKLINIHKIHQLIIDEFGEQLINYGGKQNEIGTGPLFSTVQFKFSTFFIYLLVLLLTLIVVTKIAISSFRQINQHMNSYETESIL